MVRRAALWIVVVGLLFLSATSGLAQQRVQLTMSTYYTPGTGTAIALDRVLADFEKANPDIDVKENFIPFAELIPTRLREAMVGTLPDIVFSDNPDVQHLAQAGVFQDLTPLVKAWGQWGDFNVGSRYATTLNDKIYAIHFSTNNLALFYNTDYFKSAGVAAPPRTWQDLLSVSDTLTQKLKSRGVYAIGVSAIDSEEGTWQLEPFIWSNGGSLFELNKPAAVDALQLWVTLVQKGYASRDILQWTQTTGVMAEFRAGHLAMMINGPWVLPDLRKAGVKYAIAPLPLPRAGAAPVLPMGGEVLGLSPHINAGKLEAAWTFLRFIASAQAMSEFCVLSDRVPTRGSVIPLVAKSDPDLAVFASQARRALPRPIMGGGDKYTIVSAITRRYMQQAVSGLLTPQAAFDRASQEIRAQFATPAEYQAASTAAARVLAEATGAH